MRCGIILFVYLFGDVLTTQVIIKPRRQDAEVEDNRDHQDRTRHRKYGPKWLSDSILYDDYQSDGDTVTYPSEDFCPPVPVGVSDRSCVDTNCSSDVDCQKDYRCCFSGCAFTCVPEVKPAPVVDWRVEPRRSRSGFSWLIDGPIQNQVVGETCSTTPVEKDEDPLLCPHGYFCHVTDPGRPKKGMPNSGYCVKQQELQITPGEEELALTAALGQRQTCEVDKIMLLDGARIRLNKKNCRCRKGLLSCGRNKMKKKSGVDVEIKKTKKSRKSRRNRKDKKNGKT